MQAFWAPYGLATGESDEANLHNSILHTYKSQQTLAAGCVDTFEGINMKNKQCWNLSTSECLVLVVFVNYSSFIVILGNTIQPSGLETRYIPGTWCLSGTREHPKAIWLARISPSLLMYIEISFSFSLKRMVKFLILFFHYRHSQRSWFT